MSYESSYHPIEVVKQNQEHNSFSLNWHKAQSETLLWKYTSLHKGFRESGYSLKGSGGLIAWLDDCFSKVLKVI